MITGIALLAGRVHAEEALEQIELSWSAPSQCPSADVVRARIAERLPPEMHVRVRGRVVPVGRRYRLVLEIESKGERTLEAPTCESLVASAAIIVAMSVAPERQASEPEPAPKPAVEEVVTPPPSAPVAPPPPVASERRPRVYARVHGIADVGTLPTLGAGAGLVVGVDSLAFQRLSVEIHAALWAPRDELLAGSRRGGTFQLLGAGGRACWRFTAPLQVGACAGLEVDLLSASGVGSLRSSDVTSIMMVPELGVVAALPLGRHVAVRAGVSAGVPLTRQRFTLVSGTPSDIQETTLHRSSPVVLRGWLGPELVF
jgi:hypothetical protein